MQGTGEGRPFTNRELNRLLDLGRAGVRAMMRAQREALRGMGDWLLPPRRVVVASGNAHKLKELGDIFGGMVELISMKDAGFEGDIEENGTTFEENAVIKAEAVSRATGLPALADDSGLSVDALDGAPGVYSARYAGDHGNDQANNDLLLKNMEGVTNRACRFVCAMALALPGEETRVLRGECPGELLHQRAGEGGFGYDPLFRYHTGKTFAEMTEKEKNAVSHRAVAAAKMRGVLMEALTRDLVWVIALSIPTGTRAGLRAAVEQALRVGPVHTAAFLGDGLSDFAAVQADFDGGGHAVPRGARQQRLEQPRGSAPYALWSTACASTPATAMSGTSSTGWTACIMPRWNARRRWRSTAIRTTPKSTWSAACTSSTPARFATGSAKAWPMPISAWPTTARAREPVQMGIESGKACPMGPPSSFFASDRRGFPMPGKKLFRPY